MSDLSQNTQTTEQKPATGYEVPQTDTVQNQEAPAETKESGSGVDEFGYQKEEAPAGEPAEKAGEPPKEEKEEPKSTTGYSDEPKAPEQKSTEEPKTDETPEELELGDTESLIETEVESIKAFAKEKKLSSEVAKALVEFKKKEIEKITAYQKDRQQAMEQERVNWFNELKQDKDFGGANFSLNVKKAEKVVSDFLPNLKKQLTETGAMLPPYVMKDLVNIAKHLYAQESIVMGEAIKPEENSENEKADPLAYYQ